MSDASSNSASRNGRALVRSRGGSQDGLDGHGPDSTLDLERARLDGTLKSMLRDYQSGALVGPLDPEEQIRREQREDRELELSRAHELEQQKMIVEERRQKQEAEERMAKLAADERQKEREYELELARLKAQVPQPLPLPSAQPVTIAPAVDPYTTRTRRIKEFRSSVSQVSKLTGEANYDYWAAALKRCLDGAELLGYVDGSIVVPDPGDQVALSRYKYESNAIALEMSNMVDSSNVLPHLKHLGETATPKALWDELARLYGLKDSNQASVIFSKLVGISYSESEDFDKWTSSVRDLWTSLKGTKLELPEASVCVLITNAMPSCFDPVIVNLRSQPDKANSITSLTDQLRQHWTHLKRTGAISSTTPLSAGVFAATKVRSLLQPPNLKFKDNGKKDPVLAVVWEGACRVCLGTSHKMGSKECPFWKLRVALGWQLPDPSDSNKEKKKPRSKQANVAEASQLTETKEPVETVSETEETKAFVATAKSGSFDPDGGVQVLGGFPMACAATTSGLALAVSAGSTKDAFILDSGANIHVTDMRACFVSLVKLDRPFIIEGVADVKVEGRYQGDVVIPGCKWCNVDLTSYN